MTFSAPSKKTGENEPLTRDESTDSDDGYVNENALFQQTKVKTGKRKCKRLVPTLSWIACTAVAILAVFTVVLYFTRSTTLANSFKKPQPSKTLEVNKRFKKTPEWTKTIEGFGMFLSPRHVYLKQMSCRHLVSVSYDGTHPCSPYSSWGFKLHQNSC